MFSSLALRSLEPAFSPTTTKLVFLDTEPETLPPSSSIFSDASSRVNLLRAPVRTKTFPANRVSEITWVPKEQIIAAAHMMAENGPIGLEWGCAFEHGFNATQTSRSIYMIPALLGSYDVPGGFVESKHIVPTKREPRDPHSKLINSYPYRMLKPYEPASDHERDPHGISL